jgi:hypothetical protein
MFTTMRRAASADVTADPFNLELAHVQRSTTQIYGWDDAFDVPQARSIALSWL